MSDMVKCPRCGYKMKYQKDFRDQVKGQYEKAFQPWSPEDDQQLAKAVQSGEQLLTLVQAFKRQPSAIKRRVELLGLELQPVKTGGSVNTTWQQKEQQDLSTLQKKE